MAEEDIKFSAKGGLSSGWDVVVVGAGPAGIMAAGTAARSGLKVALIEKNAELAKKLLLTGNGRCNLSNAEFSSKGGPASGWNLRELVKNYNNGEFLFHAFSVFGPEKTIKFFEELGLKTKIEGKKVFPKSDNAKEVLEALKKYLTKNKVNLFFNSKVKEIVCTGKKIKKIILSDLSTSSGQAREIVAKKYILCAGGKSYSATGSDGSGYDLVKKLGHTIVKPKPALCPIMVKEDWVKNLQGTSLDDVEISVFQNGKKVAHEYGEILFTHFGLSGPAILNISGKVGDLLERGEVKMYFDLFPLLNHEELLKGFEDVLKQNANKTVKNILSTFVPEKLAEILADIIKVDKNKIANNLSKVERAVIVKIFKNIEIAPESVLDFDVAKVTRGGISLKEIDHKTMKSELISNLFFAGEIIDVDGATGGFNLQECWSTGYLAGKSVTL